MVISDDAAKGQELELDEKLRQAYSGSSTRPSSARITTSSTTKEPPREFSIGDHKSRLTLPTGRSYSSFVLLPLLTFALCVASVC